MYEPGDPGSSDTPPFGLYWKNREMCDFLRNRYDELLLAESRDPIYDLNEDEYVLEVNGVPNTKVKEIIEVLKKKGDLYYKTYFFTCLND